MEIETRKELEGKRSEIKSFDDLVAFLKDVTENYNIGYGEAPISIAQACLAVGWFLSKEFGITGFQASYAMWGFIRDWNYRNNKCGLMLVDYDKMLYPQYENDFDKVISRDTWGSIQNQARFELDHCDYAHPEVKEHWLKIVDGNVPFGYRVEDK